MKQLTTKERIKRHMFRVEASAEALAEAKPAELRKRLLADLLDHLENAALEVDKIPDSART
jgi:hypothetical protein